MKHTFAALGQMVYLFTAPAGDDTAALAVEELLRLVLDHEGVVTERTALETFETSSCNVFLLLKALPTDVAAKRKWTDGRVSESSPRDETQVRRTSRSTSFWGTSLRSSEARNLALQPEVSMQSISTI